MSEETKQAAIVCGLVAFVALCFVVYHTVKLFAPVATP